MYRWKKPMTRCSVWRKWRTILSMMSFSSTWNRAPAIRCFPRAYLQMIRPGVETSAHRHNSCAVYFVWQGAGTSYVNGTEYSVPKGDVLVIAPSARSQTRQSNEPAGNSLFRAGRSAIEDAGFL